MESYLSGKKLNTRAIINSLKIGYTISSVGREMVMNCPYASCPNPRSHLYMNISTGKFICHRCGLAGNIITFLTIVKGTNFASIKAILEQEEPTKLEELKIRAKALRAASVASAILTGSNLRNIIPPPSDSIPISRTAYPTYLVKRRIPFSLAKRIGTRYCTRGKYFNRVIFPFSCDGNKSFVAYSTLDSIRPKTINPLGSINTNLLYLYDYMQKDKAGLIVVVEGIFDCLRMILYGYRSVALLGSYLSKSQAALLNNLDREYKTIVFMLDGEVVEPELSRKLRSLNLIDSKKVVVAEIKNKELDPDLLTSYESRKLISEAIENSSDFEHLKKRLSFMEKE